MCTCTQWCMYGGHWTIWGNWLSLSTMLVLKIELQFSKFSGKDIYSLSHLTGPGLFLKLSLLISWVMLPCRTEMHSYLRQKLKAFLLKRGRGSAFPDLQMQTSVLDALVGKEGQLVI